MGTHNTNIVGVRNSIGEFGGDLSRSFLFAVKMPALFGNYSPISTMTIFCESASVPDFTLSTKPSFVYQKLQINVVDGIQFKDWTPTFISDDRDIIRSSLLAWSSIAYDYNRKGSATPKSYKRTIQIQQLNRYGNVIGEYNMVGAFPVHVASYNLSNAEHKFVKFATTFKYDYFTYEQTSID